METKERFLIVGTGRCGSSLLSGILAHAGANFDMAPRSEWDRAGGEYEHPLIIEANKWYVRAQKISNSILPSWFRNYFHRRMEATLTSLLQRATFVKSPVLVYMVPTIARLGYKPRIILVFREFVPYSLSYHRKNGLTFSELLQKYIDVNATAVLQLYMFGGRVISYEEITDFENKEWAKVLADMTGLSAESILDSRRKLIRSTSTIPVSSSFSFLAKLDPRIEQIYETLSQLQGRIIEPVKQTRGEEVG